MHYSQSSAEAEPALEQFRAESSFTSKVQDGARPHYPERNFDGCDGWGAEALAHRVSSFVVHIATNQLFHHQFE